MDYKEGKTRNNAVMMGMVATLKPQDMEDLAAYYSQQTVKVGVADEATLNLGQSVYRGGITATGVAACMACHGPGGRGNPAAGYPAVSGQYAQYTADQLMKFRKAERANDAGRMMRNVAKRMTDEEITAVSQYMMGLH
jgi:cytochrome c553